MSNVSSWADVWMTGMIGCEAWPIKAIDPPMDWDDHPAHSPKPIKTSHPILFISNTYDPVTPLAAGLKMAKKFVNAGFLEQQSEGHCSIFSAVSRCTAEKVRAYIRTGEVPPSPVEGSENSESKWEKCQADEWPFHPYDRSNFVATNDIEAAEIQRMDAAKLIQMKSRAIKYWGQPLLEHGGLEFLRWTF